MIGLTVLGVVGLLMAFAFLTLAIASGLYYLSEMIEEHTDPTKKLFTRMIYAIMAILVLLALSDGLPWSYTALSLVSHYVYLQNLKTFPIVKTSSPTFILSCVLVLVNHFFWFRHFSSDSVRGILSDVSFSEPPDPYAYAYYQPPSFSQVSSFFGICVWLAPFSLMVGLSAGDYILPSNNTSYSSASPSAFNGQQSNAPNSGIVKSMLNSAREYISLFTGYNPPKKPQGYQY